MKKLRFSQEINYLARNANAVYFAKGTIPEFRKELPMFRN